MPGLTNSATFAGAKIALLHGDTLLTYLRDDFAHLPFPGHWDLPGGAREGDETPEACALRELEEEFGLALPPSRLVWRRDYFSDHLAGARTVFFGGYLGAEEIAAIRFGSEGQRWEMMAIGSFLSHGQAVPHLQRRLADWLSAVPR